MRCDTCKHKMSGTEKVIVDNKVVAEYDNWDCIYMDDNMTDEQIDTVCDGGDCPFYEYDKNLDDPCYGCPGSPDYCDKCNGREKE